MTNKMPQLGYEQQLLLDDLSDDETELSAFCKKHDCSWTEAYLLSDYGLAVIRSDDDDKRVYIRKARTI